MKKLSVIVVFLFVFLLKPQEIFADDPQCTPVRVRDCVQDNCSQDPNSCLQACKDSCATLSITDPSSWYNKDQVQWEKVVIHQPPEQVNGERFAYSWLQNFVHGGVLDIGGQQTTSTNGPATGNKGAIGFFASNIQFMLEKRPASSIDYVAYMGRKLHVPGMPDDVYAADPSVGGKGFDSLQPVLKIWTVSRNLAYIIFALLFIVVGIMIMTRQKIDPKTVATVQNALPKMIFALLLVTFSYAIAGFLIDMMYVVLAILVTLISSVEPGFGQTLESTILSRNLFTYVFAGEFWGTAVSAAASVNSLVGSFVNGPGRSGVAGSVLGLVTSGLALLIILVALLIALFRTWLTLIGAYAHIILAVIFAPLRLTLDAIPGQNQFSAWLRDLLANLLAFPLVAGLLIIGTAIATNFGKGITVGPGGDAVGFAPPLIGAGDAQAMAGLVGLGIILTIPKAVDILRETLKAPAFKFGSAWSENLNAARSGVTGGAGILWNRYQNTSERQIEKKGKEKFGIDQKVAEIRAARGLPPVAPP